MFLFSNRFQNKNNLYSCVKVILSYNQSSFCTYLLLRLPTVFFTVIKLFYETKLSAKPSSYYAIESKMSTKKKKKKTVVEKNIIITICCHRYDRFAFTMYMYYNIMYT